MNEIKTLGAIFGVLLLYNSGLFCASAADAIRSRGSVRYNHPPIVYEQPIPVAIVYEEKNDRGAKQIPVTTTTPATTTKVATTVPITSTKPIASRKRTTTPVPVTTTKHVTTTVPSTAKPVLTTVPATTTTPVTTTKQPIQTGSRYQYNHPPEVYQPIPVAIVYEEKDDRGAKQLLNELVSIMATTTQKSFATSVAAINNDSSTKHFKQDYDDIKVTTWKPPRANAIPPHNDRTSFRLNSFYPVAEQHIPVAIVYDPEPIVVRKKLDKDSSSPSNSRKQKQYIDVSAFRQTTDKVDITTTSTNRSEEISETQLIPQLTQNISKNTSKNKDVATPKLPTATTQAVTENLPKQSSLDEKISITTSAPKRASEDKTRGDKNPELLKSDRPSLENKKVVPKAPVAQESNDVEPKGKTREKDPVVPILASENHIYAQNGAYHYSYEGGDGTNVFSKGELKEFDDEKTGESVSGGFSYMDREGRDISLTYTADENGYRPVGAHLPTPPPIPPAIARALAYLATKPTEPSEEDVTEPTKTV